MLKTITDEAAIKRCRGRFVRGLRMFAPERIPVRLGHPGASERIKVFWSERLGIWFFSRKIADSRYWNGFGTGRPEAGASGPSFRSAPKRRLPTSTPGQPSFC
jgi:hypothetical protein